MAGTQTDKLYVNLSASQTRKRLKGHGFGVRRVETAGRNQAAITHTATGSHLQDLKALFHDAVPADSFEETDTPVRNLKNLGATSVSWLRDAGIRTRTDLERLGPVNVWRLVKQRQPHAILNLLWAVAGALEDVDWRDLSSETKERLRLEAEDEG